MTDTWLQQCIITGDKIKRSNTSRKYSKYNKTKTIKKIAKELLIATITK